MNELGQAANLDSETNLPWESVGFESENEEGRGGGQTVMNSFTDCLEDFHVKRSSTPIIPVSIKRMCINQRNTAISNMSV